MWLHVAHLVVKGILVDDIIEITKVLQENKILKVKTVDITHFKINYIKYTSLVQALPDAHPLVLSHFKTFTDLKSNPDAQSVTHQNIKNEGVPPALNKIWQQMSKGNL